MNASVSRTINGCFFLSLSLSLKINQYKDNLKKQKNLSNIMQPRRVELGFELLSDLDTCISLLRLP